MAFCGAVALRVKLVAVMVVVFQCAVTGFAQEPEATTPDLVLPESVIDDGVVERRKLARGPTLHIERKPVPTLGSTLPHGAVLQAKSRNTNAWLRFFCYLGDAGVVDVEVPDCGKIAVPKDYVRFCGRWQCSDPQIDHCFFTDANTALTLELPLQNVWDAPKDVAPMTQQGHGHMHNVNSSLDSMVTVPLNTISSYTDNVNGDTTSNAQTNESDRTNDMALRRWPRFRLRRPCCLAACPQRLPGELFNTIGAVTRAQCSPAAPVHRTVVPMCSLDVWLRESWKTCFPAAQKRAGDQAVSSAAGIPGDGSDAPFLSRVWRSLGVGFAATLQSPSLVGVGVSGEDGTSANKLAVTAGFSKIAESSRAGEDGEVSEDPSKVVHWHSAAAQLRRPRCPADVPPRRTIPPKVCSVEAWVKESWKEAFQRAEEFDARHPISNANGVSDADNDTPFLSRVWRRIGVGLAATLQSPGASGGSVDGGANAGTDVGLTPSPTNSSVEIAGAQTWEFKRSGSGLQESARHWQFEQPRLGAGSPHRWPGLRPRCPRPLSVEDLGAIGATSPTWCAIQPPLEQAVRLHVCSLNAWVKASWKEFFLRSGERLPMPVAWSTAAALNTGAVIDQHRLHLRSRRPRCLATCARRSPAELFGALQSSARMQCGLEDPMQQADVLPVCLVDTWIKESWTNFFRQASERQADVVASRVFGAVQPVVLRPRCLGDQCRLAEPFWQCDAHLGTFLSRVWRRIGMSVAAKLHTSVATRVGVGGATEICIDEKPPPTAPPAITIGGSTGDQISEANRTRGGSSSVASWRHCADEGELCLCTGDVRFLAGDGDLHEVLTVQHGMVACDAGFFEAGSATTEGAVRSCECLEVGGHDRPLVTPGAQTVPATGRKPPEAYIPQGRFLRGTQYPDAIRNGVRFDYASVGAGARLVTHARGIKKASAILSHDSEYLRTLCDNRAWFVVSLLEDLFLEHVGLVTLEFFASGFRHLQILGSSKYPTDRWRLLGEIETNGTATHELFDVGSRCRHQTDMCWVRFLKVRVLSHHELEDNSYCALTRFQAFGSTQMTYIAEEQREDDIADPRLEPTVADVADWHDKAARAALEGLPIESWGLVHDETSPGVVPNVPTAPEELAHNDTTEQLGSVEELGLVPRDLLTQTRLRASGSNLLRETPLNLLRSFATWVLRGELFRQIEGQETKSPDELDRASAAVQAEAERLAAEEGSPRLGTQAGVAEPVQPSFSEVVAELGASGAFTDADFSAFDALGSALLNEHGFVAMAGSAALGGAAASPSPAPRPARSSSSSSTPALVRIHNDLRVVLDDQAVLEKRVKSVTYFYSKVLVHILQTLQKHNTRVKAVEEAQLPFSWACTDSEQVCDISNTTGGSSNDDSARIGTIPGFLRIWAVWFLTTCTFDRFILLGLVAWQVLNSRRAATLCAPTSSIPSSETVGSVPEVVVADPPVSQPSAAPPDRQGSDTITASATTISGATGRRLAHELKTLQKTLRGGQKSKRSSVLFLPELQVNSRPLHLETVVPPAAGGLAQVSLPSRRPLKRGLPFTDRHTTSASSTSRSSASGDRRPGEPQPPDMVGDADEQPSPPGRGYTGTDFTTSSNASDADHHSRRRTRYNRHVRHSHHGHPWHLMPRDRRNAGGQRRPQQLIDNHEPALDSPATALAVSLGVCADLDAQPTTTGSKQRRHAPKVRHSSAARRHVALPVRSPHG